MTRMAVALPLVLVACTGYIGDDSFGEPRTEPQAAPSPGTSPLSGPPPADDNPTLGTVSGARRLTNREYANTVAQLLGERLTESDMALYPENVASIYGNDYQQQTPSRTLIDGAETLGERLAAKAVTAAGREAFVGCRPAMAADATCMTTFLRAFGRRVLRRPVRADEVQFFLPRALARATADNDFYRGVEFLVRTLLQDLEFLYRIEAGQQVSPGIAKLTSHEVATRLSYLLWEGPPEDATGLPLAKLADEGKLRTRQEVRDAAQIMLAQTRGQAQLRRFHALWMGYDFLSTADAARVESSALVDRILFKDRGKRPWVDLFRIEESYVNEALAKQYGMTWPAGTRGYAWVPYGATPRKGVVSHASVLSHGVADEETSQIHRGKFALETFFCIDVPELTDELRMRIAMTPLPPSTGSDCKIDRARSRLDPSTLCSGCHRLLEPAGFGLENYDAAGRYRTQEPTTGCSILGVGEILGVGKFKGLGGGNGLPGMGDLMVDSQAVDSCGVKQYFRFAMGRYEADETAQIDALAGRFRQGRHDFTAMVLDLVSSEAFRYQKEVP